LERLRGLHEKWMDETRDLGLMPEAVLWERAKDTTPYEVGKADKGRTLACLREVAPRLAGGKMSTSQLRDLYAQPVIPNDPALAWWVMAEATRQPSKPAREVLLAGFKHDSRLVRIAAGQGLPVDSRRVLQHHFYAHRDDNPWVRHAAILALDELIKAHNED